MMKFHEKVSKLDENSLAFSVSSPTRQGTLSSSSPSPTRQGGRGLHMTFSNLQRTVKAAFVGEDGQEDVDNSHASGTLSEQWKQGTMHQLAVQHAAHRSGGGAGDGGASGGLRSLGSGLSSFSSVGRASAKLRRAARVRLQFVTPREIVQCRESFDSCDKPPLSNPYHISLLLHRLNMCDVPTVSAIEDLMFKVGCGQGPKNLYLSFDHFIQIVELIKRDFVRTYSAEDECTSAFRHISGSEPRASSPKEAGYSCLQNRVSIDKLDNITSAVGVEYDYNTLFSGVTANFSGEVDASQFRFCVGTEDPDIVRAFVALGGEDTLSGTIPIDTLIQRCEAMGMTPQYVANFVSEVDANDDGVIDFSEFLAMVLRSRDGRDRLKRTWSKAKEIPKQKEEKANSPRKLSSQKDDPFPRRGNFMRQRTGSDNSPSFVIPAPPATSTAAPLPPSNASPPPRRGRGGGGVPAKKQVNEKIFEKSMKTIFLDDADNISETSSSSSQNEEEVDASGTLQRRSSNVVNINSNIKNVNKVLMQSFRRRKSQEESHHAKLNLAGLLADTTQRRASRDVAVEGAHRDRIMAGLDQAVNKGLHQVRGHRERVSKYLNEEAHAPQALVATPAHGVVEVSTEKGLRKMKYYFGVNRNIPKRCKVSPHLAALPLHVTDLLEAEIQATEKKKKTADAKAKESKQKLQRYVGAKSDVATQKEAVACLFVIAAAASTYAHVILDESSTQILRSQRVFMGVYDAQREVQRSPQSVARKNPNSNNSSKRPFTRQTDLNLALPYDDDDVFDQPTIVSHPDPLLKCEDTDHEKAAPSQRPTPPQGSSDRPSKRPVRPSTAGAKRPVARPPAKAPPAQK